jgi:hypothetical protein
MHVYLPHSSAVITSVPGQYIVETVSDINSIFGSLTAQLYYM